MIDSKNLIAKLLDTDILECANGGDKLNEWLLFSKRTVTAADEEELRALESEVRDRFTLAMIPAGTAYSYGYFNITGVISRAIAERRLELISVSSPDICGCQQRHKSGLMSPEGLTLDRKEEDYESELFYYHCDRCGQPWIDEVSNFSVTEHRWKPGEEA